MVKSLFRFRVVIGIVLAVMVASLIGLGYTATDSEGRTASLLGLREFLEPTIAVQKRHTDRLMDIPDVVGTAVGLTADGRPEVKVYTRAAGIARVPDSLEGIPVKVEVTGEFFALPASMRERTPAGQGGGGIDPKSRFNRPVPIGISTGNEGECSAGTIGARVAERLLIDGTVVDYYALSNNHVYARENAAPTGSNVLQPGLFDTNCVVDLNNDVIGTLAAFVPIVFSTSANNTVDAAIALSSVENLGNATPSNGYGMPRSATAPAFVGQKVQKYGRTSGLTKGEVRGINATISVGYGSGTARFVGQIIVRSGKPFIRAGDSGSLLVTDSSRNPVGLLYAGTVDGKTAIANPINEVLTQLGAQLSALKGSPRTLTIDGE